MEPVNLDNTAALKKIAEELGAIDQTLNSLMVITAGIAAQKTEPKKTEAEPAGAEPAGVPILLIVEVLIALIGVLLRNVNCGPAASMKLSALRSKLSALRRKLEPYQPVRPAGEEAE